MFPLLLKGKRTDWTIHWETAKVWLFVGQSLYVMHCVLQQRYAVGWSDLARF